IITNMGLTGQSIDSWIRLFRKLDKDHSGSLDFHEICSLFGGDRSSEDRDGRIDIKEFLTFVAEQAEHPVV
ncbi:hypothetical protein EWB00_000305, partial [Schistosoma japonicum]